MDRNCQNKCSQCSMCLKFCQCNNSEGRGAGQKFSCLNFNFNGTSVSFLGNLCTSSGLILETQNFKKGCCKLWDCRGGVPVWIVPEQNPFYFYDNIQKRIFKSVDATCCEFVGRPGDKVLDLITSNMYEYCDGWQLLGTIGSGSGSREVKSKILCALRWVEPNSLNTPLNPGQIVNDGINTPSTGDWFVTLQRDEVSVTASVFPTLNLTNGPADSFSNPGPTGAALFISPLVENLEDFFPDQNNQRFTFSVVGGQIGENASERFMQAIVSNKQLQDLNNHSDVINDAYGGFYIYDTGFDENGNPIIVPFEVGSTYFLKPFSVSWALCPGFAPDLEASFTATPTSSSTAPLTVQFTDTSTTSVGVINSWFWTFGDGNTSNLQNPEHTYTVVGSFTVSLTIGNSVGTNASRTVSDFIMVGETFNANFRSCPNTGVINTLIEFRDISTTNEPIDSWSWDFGDTTTSTEQNPDHTYSAPGFYTVKLEITAGNRLDMEVKEKFVLIWDPATTETFDIFYIPMDITNIQPDQDFVLSWFTNSSANAGTNEYCPSQVFFDTVVSGPILQTNKNGEAPYLTGAASSSKVYIWTFPKTIFQEFTRDNAVSVFGFKITSRTLETEYTQNVYINAVDQDLDSITIQRTISRDIATSEFGGYWEIFFTPNGQSQTFGPNSEFFQQKNSVITNVSTNGTYDVNTGDFAFTSVGNGNTSEVFGKLISLTSTDTGTGVITFPDNSTLPFTFRQEKFGPPTGISDVTNGTLDGIDLVPSSSNEAVGQLNFSDESLTVLRSAEVKTFSNDLFYQISFGATGLGVGQFEVGLGINQAFLEIGIAGAGNNITQLQLTLNYPSYLNIECPPPQYGASCGVQLKGPVVAWNQGNAPENDDNGAYTNLIQTTLATQAFSAPQSIVFEYILTWTGEQTPVISDFSISNPTINSGLIEPRTPVTNASYSINKLTVIKNTDIQVRAQDSPSHDPSANAVAGTLTVSKFDDTGFAGNYDIDLDTAESITGSFNVNIDVRSYTG